MNSSSEKSVQLEELMPLIREALSSGGSVRLSPRGTSMLPMLRQGVDQVVLSPVNGRLQRFDLPLYQRENGQYVLHRIVAAGETYICVGDNQFDLEHGIRQDQLIAVVTSFFRAEKEISVTSFGYRCYCRFWHYSRPIRLLWRKVMFRLRRLLR